MTENGPDWPDDQAQDLAGVEHRLRAERPVISAMQRGRIRRGLETRGRAWRPRRLWTTAAGFAAAGLATFALVGVTLANSGPLAPDRALVSGTDAASVIADSGR